MGATRAKNSLNLFRLPEASVFCRDLTRKPVETKKKEAPQKKTFSEAEYKDFCDSLGEGIPVFHRKYGAGVVSEMREEYVTIQFDDCSRKFILQIAFQSGMLKVEE